MAQESREQLLNKINMLSLKLEEAQDTLSAIQSGVVDALLIEGESGPQVYTLTGAQHPYRIIVETMNEGSVTISSDGIILYCNNHFAEMVDCPLQNVIGASFFQFMASGYHQSIEALIDNPGNSIKTEAQLECCDGRTMPVILSTSPLPVEYGLDGHCLVVTDMSLQKQTEETLRQYAEQNARLSQELSQYAAVLEERVQNRTAELEAINRELEAFTYTVSHDLRAPLRSINGFAELLMSKFSDQLNEKSRFYLDKILENAADLDELITALLTLSRHNSRPLEKKRVDPRELVERALDDLHVETQKGRLEIRVENLPRCLADPILLKQVYVNLLSNAIKFSANREKAVVEVGCQTLPSEVDGTGTSKDQLVYYVKDNGVGFDVEQAPNVFGVFQRYHSKKDYDGIGVGLAIVQRIIHRHGGRIWVESKVNQGASFYFTLSE